MNLSAIKVAHCRKLFCQLGYRARMLCFSLVNRDQASLRRCGQSRAMQPTAVVELPTMTLVTCQLRSSLQDGTAVWTIITILLQYYNIWHCHTLLIYSLKKKKNLLLEDQAHIS